MSLFPMFLKLEGRSCLVAGAGNVAESKIRSLLAAGADVRVVAPMATPAVARWARLGVVSWEGRTFAASDLEGVFLAIAATSSPVVNEVVFAEAQRRSILCNSVDDPEHCDFYYPAVVRRGQLQFAISTGGNSPALAQRLKRELEGQFGAEYAGWVDELGELREQIFADNADVVERRQLLHHLASRQAFEAAQSDEAAEERS